MIRFILIPIVLLFYIKDNRIASSGLIKQRLPRILNVYDDGAETGINGTFRHQAKVLLNTDQDLREGLLNNALIMTYDREMEGKSVPRFLIYKMRLLWLLRKR